MWNDEYEEWSRVWSGECGFFKPSAREYEPLIQWVQELQTQDRPESEPEWVPGPECAANKVVWDFIGKLIEMIEPTEETIMEQVKLVVLALNELHEKGEFPAEEEERRVLCSMIRIAAEARGLQACEGDITAAWRTW